MQINQNKGDFKMVKDLINRLNKYCAENAICDMEEDEFTEEFDEELESINFHYICSVDYDEHRWYRLSQNVYGVCIDGKNYYIGVWEVDRLYSEAMTVYDCDHQLFFFEMEEYTTASYRVKE